MRYIPFNFDWTFTDGPERFFLLGEGETGQAVDLPHDYVIGRPRDPHCAGGAATGFFPGGQGAYTKKFARPDDWRGQRVLLNIDGAYMLSEVTLNGDLLNLHPYGYTAYQVDLTDKLREENTLKIALKCPQPNSRWYSGAGLYREVGLYVGGQCHIHPWDVFVTTPAVDAERAVVQVDMTVAGANGSYEIDLEILDEDGAAVARQTVVGEKETVAARLRVAHPALWDVEEPHLYTLRYALKCGDSRDRGETRFGIRFIEIDARRGFRLNGEKMKLRGGCIHHDNTLLGACAFPAAEKRKIEKLKAAGYNAIRTAHNPPSTALLNACDELGMLVLDESFDMWRTGKNALDYHLWFEDWWQRDTAAMVKRDRNHPCVYAWSIGNEIQEMLNVSGGAKWAALQADYVRSLDPTRPVSASANGFTAPDPSKPRKPHDFKRELAGKPVMGLPRDGQDDWGEQTRLAGEALDIFGYNYMYGRYAYDKEKFPDRVIHATETHSYFTYDYWQAVLANENCIGDFIWTAFDNLGEAGAGRVIYDPGEMRGGLMGGWPWLSCYQGDLDLSGDARPQNYYRRVMWGLDKGVHLYTTHPSRTGQPFYGMGWHWEDVKRDWSFDREFEGRPVKAQAYADCDQVEFFLNGASVGIVAPVEYKAVLEIPYAPGRLEAVALKNGEIVARDELVTAGPAARLALLPERSRLSADGMDIGYIHIELLDAAGVPIVSRPVRVQAEVSGAGCFAALGSGDPCTEENYTDSRQTFEGRALLCVRAARRPGPIAVTVRAEGLPEAHITLQCQ